MQGCHESGLLEHYADFVFHKGGVPLELLSGCTILSIISCSSFALSKYLQMVVNLGPPIGRDAGSVFVWHVQNPRHFSPSPQGRRLVHHLHSGRSQRHQLGYIIFT